MDAWTGSLTYVYRNPLTLYTTNCRSCVLRIGSQEDEPSRLIDFDFIHENLLYVVDGCCPIVWVSDPVSPSQCCVIVVL
jgi:hypothetical protein